jgi:hypothetical protein
MNKWKIKKILSSPVLKLVMNTRVHFNNKYEIPFIFGLSKDGRTIYFDKDFPRYFKHRGKTLDSYEMLKSSELMRLALQYIFKLPSETVNDIVGDYENEITRQKLGIGSDVFAKLHLSKHSRPYMNDTLTKLPPDIDLVDLNLNNEVKNEMIRYKREYDSNKLLTTPHEQYKIKKKEKQNARNLHKTKLSRM